MTPAILLADIHALIFMGLRQLLEKELGYYDVDSVTSCSAILKQLKRRRYTHLVLEIGLSDGSALEILPTIKVLYPAVKILVYSVQPKAYGNVLKKLGVCHCLSKQATEQETIHRFRLFLGSQEVHRQEAPLRESPFSQLTVRQLEVMHYLLNGKSGVEIAELLNVTRATVSILKSRLFERTGVGSTRELLVLAGHYSLI